MHRAWKFLLTLSSVLVILGLERRLRNALLSPSSSSESSSSSSSTSSFSHEGSSNPPLFQETMKNREKKGEEGVSSSMWFLDPRRRGDTSRTQTFGNREFGAAAALDSVWERIAEQVDLGVSRALDFSLRFADEIESSCRRLQKKLRLGVSRTARRHGRNMRVDEKNHYSNSTVSMNHLCSVPPVGESPVTGLSSDGVEIFVMDQHELDDDAAVLFSFSRSLRELADSVDRSLGRLKATERLHGEPSDLTGVFLFSILFAIAAYSRKWHVLPAEMSPASGLPSSSSSRMYPHTIESSLG